MVNRFVCTKCRKNISEYELANIVRTRYDDKIHTFCPYCENHIVSFINDKYETRLEKLTTLFKTFGADILCYYEGYIEQDKNCINLYPVIFRVTDIEGGLFYKIACKSKQANEIMEDLHVINENDGSITIIGGEETWYIDTDQALESLNKYFFIIKKLINAFLYFGSKQTGMMKVVKND